VTIVDSAGNTLTNQGTVSIVNNKLVFVAGTDFDSLAVGETATVTVRYNGILISDANINLICDSIHRQTCTRVHDARWHPG
jgi:hypothetical protein